MSQEIITDSMSTYALILKGINPLAATIVPLLPIFQDRIHSDKSWRVYKQDMKHFIEWLSSYGVTTTEQITLDVMYAYHAHLRHYRYGKKEKPYSNIAINRMFSVARRLIGIMAEKKILTSNPCLDLDIKKMSVEDETTHEALSKEQAKQLLANINRSTLKGKRDYALVSLLMRTGLRRNEARMLNIEDFHMERGHHVATIHYAKGGKPGRVKIPPDVWLDIETYQRSFTRVYYGLDAPLFVSFQIGDRISISTDKETGRKYERRIDEKGIELLVKKLGAKIGVPGLTPHGLRATFITLALEEGATLEQTQYAARHKDPRMTERYRKRKFNLDNNAVDKLSFLARDDEE